MDEREDADVEADVNSLPFVLNEEIVAQYGNKYSISFDEKGLPVVAAENCPAPKECETTKQQP